MEPADPAPAVGPSEVRDEQIEENLKRKEQEEDVVATDNPKMRNGKLEVEPGTEIYYEVHGSGTHKLLLIMGFATSGQAWRHTVDYFVNNHEEYEICIFDNRGTGRSSTPKSNYSTSQMAADAHKLLLHLCWDDVHVVGISMGGMIAMELALRLGGGSTAASKSSNTSSSSSPSLSTSSSCRLLSLALAVTHAGGLTAIAPFTGLWGMLTNMFKPQTEKAVPLMKILYSERFLESKCPTDESKTNLEVVAQAYLDRVLNEPVMQLEGLKGHLRAVSTHYVSKTRLKQIKDMDIPIVVMTGTIDHLVRPSNSKKLAQVLEPAEFLIFEGAGHAINIECFDEFHAAVLRNIKRAVEAADRTESENS
jgi:pimeloyl-ACP methyl ester carboxylesterase